MHYCKTAFGALSIPDPSMNNIVQLLEWDTEFFGHRIARLNKNCLDNKLLNEALDWCQKQGIECLYFLCASDDDQSVMLAEAAGFHQVDIRVELNWKTVEPITLPSKNLREAQALDIKILQQIAAQAFTNTRFSFDDHFNSNRVADLYQRWVAGSCANDSHKVFVAGEDSNIEGFITCQFDDSAIGRIGLLSLVAESHGKGYGRALVQTAQRYFVTAGVTEVKVVTQARNIAAQRLYQSCGFRTYQVGLWYHKWL